jgi:hypothetical protein
MPSKTCPECGEQHGSRKKKCKCGYVFIGGTHPLHPEPGGWILDTFKGLPGVRQPEPLPFDRKMTRGEVQEYIAYEGLGFSVYSLIPFDKIEDKQLAQLWKKARAEMQKIIEYLEAP